MNNYLEYDPAYKVRPDRDAAALKLWDLDPATVEYADAMDEWKALDLEVKRLCK